MVEAWMDGWVGGWGKRGGERERVCVCVGMDDAMII